MSTVLHRFTSPTCTLEIKDEKLPLSYRSQFQFELKFEDPQGSTSEPVTIKGDRQDLERLIEAVDSYLQKSPQPFRHDIEGENLDDGKFKNTQSDSRSPELANCELFFDFLNSDHNVDRLELSKPQLFDLVTVLEIYRDATQPGSKPKTAKVFILGGLITAIVVVVGISQILLRTPTPDIARSKEESTAPIAELDEVVPPPASTTADRSIPQPKLSEPLTSVQKLPPPPAVDTPKPKPNIPDPANYPLPEVARQSRINIARQPASKEPTESLAIAPEANEATIPTQSTTIQIDSGANPKIDKSDRSYSESSKEAEYNPPNQIAKASQPSQIQQITTYFQERWQPPAELKQSLEYRLWLNADGTIQRVVPLGKASQLYIDRTKIPLKGESFINSRSQSSIVRLLLSPDGGVQVLSE